MSSEASVLDRSEDGSSSATLMASQYSRAFENMVDGPDDTVGLLAYALFKQAIREDASKGLGNSGAMRNPSKTVVQVFRESAERKLQEFAGRAIEEAAPEILEENTLAAIAGAQAAIISRIDNRTSMKSAISSNLVAWVITLAVTVLIIYTIYLPNWTADLIEKMRHASGTSVK